MIAIETTEDTEEKYSMHTRCTRWRENILYYTTRKGKEEIRKEDK